MWKAGTFFPSLSFPLNQVSDVLLGQMSADTAKSDATAGDRSKAVQIDWLKGNMKTAP